MLNDWCHIGTTIAILFLCAGGFYNTRSLILARDRIERLEAAVRELSPGLNI